MDELLITNRTELLVENDTARETVTLIESEMLEQTVQEVIEFRTPELLIEQMPSPVEVLDTTRAFEILDVGRQGPPGPAGPAGPPGEVAQTAIAGEALGGHRCAVLDAAGNALYADCGTPAHLGRLVGITSGAVIVGDVTTIVSRGNMADPSWVWVTDAPVFLGHSGLLTQLAPDDGFQQIVGIATSETTLFVSLREPIATI